MNVKVGEAMYKNRSASGACNICGEKVANLRKKMFPKVSQRAFAEILQLEGLDLDKNAIQKIEHGKRFVVDFELKVIARVLGVTTDFLLLE